MSASSLSRRASSVAMRRQSGGGGEVKPEATKSRWEDIASRWSSEGVDNASRRSKEGTDAGSVVSIVRIRWEDFGGRVSSTSIVTLALFCPLACRLSLWPLWLGLCESAAVQAEVSQSMMAEKDKAV